MTKDKTKVVEKSMLVPFIMLVSCFVLWGLLNNMTDNLVPAFGKIFMMSAVDSSFVQIAFYGAYAVLAIPAAIIIKKFSYRVGVLFGLGLYMIGALGYIPSAIIQSYDMFLVSIFVLACGLSVLETTCNPYVISLGTKETSIQRLNFAQAFNPLGSLAGIFLAKYMILAHLNPATYEERIAMEPDVLNSIQNDELLWVCAIRRIGLDSFDNLDILLQLQASGKQSGRRRFEHRGIIQKVNTQTSILLGCRSSIFLCRTADNRMDMDRKICYDCVWRCSQ